MRGSAERFARALAGEAAEPPAAGLAFVPVGALAPWASPLGEAETLAAAVRAVSLDFAFVPAAERWASDAVGLLAEDASVAVWAFDGPLGEAMRRRGFAQAIRLSQSEPEALGAEVGAGFECCAVALAQGVSLGAGAVVVAEDLAGDGGPLFAPEFLSGHVMPVLGRLASLAVESGVPALLHSDGDVERLLGDVAEAGFTGVHLGGGRTEEDFERLFWAARQAGLAVAGGIRARELAAGMPAALHEGARTGLLAAAGGLLVADDGGITTAAEASALATALSAARGGIL